MDVVCGGPRPWTASQLEELIRDKVRMKTIGANGRAFEAISLFERKGEANEIGPEVSTLEITSEPLGNPM